MNEMRKLLSLMEGVMAVPGISAAPGGSESDMQTSGTVGRNQSYSQFDASQGQATEEGIELGDDNDTVPAYYVVNDDFKVMDGPYSEDEFTPEDVMREMRTKHWYNKNSHTIEYGLNDNGRFMPADGWSKYDDFTAQHDTFKESPESPSQVVSCNQDNPVNAAEACAMEENMYGSEHSEEAAMAMTQFQTYVMSYYMEPEAAYDKVVGQMTPEAVQEFRAALEAAGMNDRDQSEKFDQEVNEGHWWRDPDDDPDEMPEEEMAEHLSLVDYYVSKGMSEAHALQRIAKDLMDDGAKSEMVRRITNEIKTELDRRAEQEDMDESDLEPQASADLGMDKDYGSAEEMYEVKPDLINAQEINSMARLPHDQAKARASEIINGTNTTDIKKQYLLRQVEGSRNTMGVVKLLYDMILKGEGHGVQGSSYSKRFDRGMEEGLNNGYDDVERMTGSDYFPNGADGPVVRATGPSGARQGDNPEQKKMQVAETHTELVYSYRNYLKESAKPR